MSQGTNSSATCPVREVICNTSPLQYLHQADLLHLMPALFGGIQVPSAVAAELAEGKRRGIHLPELAELPWVTVRLARERRLLPLVTSLGNGEKEVLALGLEASDHLLVLDDRDARRHAIAAGLNVTGTLGVLLLAKGTRPSRRNPASPRATPGAALPAQRRDIPGGTRLGQRTPLSTSTTQFTFADTGAPRHRPGYTAPAAGISRRCVRGPRRAGRRPRRCCRGGA